jgi:hypothetical protein
MKEDTIQQGNRFRIVEKVNGFETKVYVQERVRLLFFRWWMYHSNENSRYNGDWNFGTVQEAAGYIISYKNKAKKPKYKKYHYDIDNQTK